MTLYEQSQAAYEEIGEWYGAEAVYGQGKVALRKGNFARAVRSFRDAITAGRESAPLTFNALEGLGAVWAEQGEGERAATLWGGVEALRRASGTGREPYERPDYERWTAAARARFDAATFAAAWEAGRALSREDVIAEALRRTDKDSASEVGRVP